MAKSNQSANQRTTPIDVPAPNSNGVMAAWDGLYHFFGARFDSVETNEDGLVVLGLTFDGQYNAETIVSNINQKGRRVPLFPTINWINGAAPEPITDPKEMTAWLVNFFRGSVEEGSTRAPKYARDAVAAYKGTLGISNKRGPKPRTLSLKNVSTVDASVLRNAKVSDADLQHLIAIAQEALAASEAPVEAAS